MPRPDRSPTPSRTCWPAASATTGSSYSRQPAGEVRRTKSKPTGSWTRFSPKFIGHGKSSIKPHQSESL